MIVPTQVKNLIAMALEEDLGRGDPTSFSVPQDAVVQAKIIAREPIVASCLWLVPLVIEEARSQLVWNTEVKDGQKLKPNAVIAKISGNARELLGLERTILNFLQRTCGVATYANQYSEILKVSKDKHLKIVDTRKTIPGWRYLDKCAVRDGGLYNHRYGLDSGILIKENHIRAAGGIRAAILAVKAAIPHGLLIEIEVTTLAEAKEAIMHGAEAILLDNFSAKDLAEAIKIIRTEAPKILLEASGGINLKNIHEYINIGLDIISIGALTHSAPAANLSMLFDFQI